MEDTALRDFKALDIVSITILVQRDIISNQQFWFALAGHQNQPDFITPKKLRYWEQREF